MKQHFVRNTTSLDRPLAAPAFHISKMWRETLSVYLTLAPAVLVWSLVGIAGVRMMCLLLSVVIGIQLFVHSAGAFLTTSGLLSVASIVDQRLLVLLMTQATFGALLHAFSKGAITYLALQTPHDPEIERSEPTCRVIKRHFPALLAGSLLNSAICALAAIMLIVPLLVLRIDPVSSMPSRTLFGRMNELSESISVQYINMAANESGSPFAEFVPHWRNVALRHAPIWIIRSQHTSHDLSDRNGNRQTSYDRLLNWRFVLCASMICIMLMLFTNVLLRFFPATVLTSAHRQNSPSMNLFISLAASIEFGIRHFVVIAVHVLMLRMIFVIACAIFIILPNVLIKREVMPALTDTSGATWLAPASMILTAICLAAASAVIEGFITIYNARLYLSLKPAK